MRLSIFIITFFLLANTQAQTLFHYDTKGNLIAVVPTGINTYGCVAIQSTTFNYDPKGNQSVAQYLGTQQCQESQPTAIPPAIKQQVDTATVRPSTSVAIFRLFPNPATRNITVQYQLARQQPAQIIIADITGHRIAHLPYKPSAGINNLHFDASHLAAGLYLCTLITPDGTWTLKWEKQ